MAAAILALLPALFQAGMGIYQTAKGSQMAKEPVPDYEISPALKNMIKMQRTYASSEMAGTQSMINEQRQTAANQMGEMAKYGLLDPNAINRIYNQTNENLGQIGLMGTQYRLGEKDKYLNLKQGLAEEEKTKFDWEVLLPYDREMKAASGLMGSGLQNVYGAGTSVADFFGNREMMEAMGYTPNSLFGNWFKKNI